jgi:hypothetical protein
LVGISLSEKRKSFALLPNKADAVDYANYFIAYAIHPEVIERGFHIRRQM